MEKRFRLQVLIAASLLVCSVPVRAYPETAGVQSEISAGRSTLQTSKETPDGVTTNKQAVTPQPRGLSST